MRILHVFDHSAPLHSGYAFRSLAILREQRARGWDTAQMTTPRHGASAEAEEVAEGFTFFRTSPPTGRLARVPMCREVLEMRAAELRLGAVIEATGPDILHAHSPVLNALPALRAGRRHGLPVVYEVRALWEDAAVSHGTARRGGPRYAVTRAAESYALRRADAITTICEGLRADIVGRGLPAERVTVIPNAVDPGAFAAGAARDQGLARRLGLDRATVLGFIGSFYGYEGLEFLVRAMPAILARRPDVRLLLLGGGPEDERLRRVVDEIGLGGKVRMPGRVPHAEVGAYYELVDVFVYPRRRMRLTETVTPLKPLEAMASGKLVLASDVGGHRELVEDGVTGVLFRADDSADLVAKVDDLLGSREDWPALARRARDYVERERTWRRSVARYEPVYERLVEGRRRRPG
ncbi:MAG: TIGR04063 family PEP-CTERM/XrtA system glycosyltransferase [Alphaproteobacteria bacterium]